MLTINFPDDVHSDISSVDLRALTRQSRDLMVLAIRSFSALTYFHNSKAIKFLNSGSEVQKSDDEETKFEVSEVLIELDFVKRELYEQIDNNRKIHLEKD